MTASRSSISAAADDDHTPTSAAEEEGGGGVLPLRLVREVLVRLPAKPLCRLRAVCRSWRSLLADDRAFAAAHARRHPAPLFAAVVVVTTAWGKTMRVDMVDASGALVNQVPAGWWRRGEPKTMVRVRTDHHLAAVAVEHRCLRLRVVNLATGVVSFVPTRLQDRRPHPSPSPGAPKSGAAARRPPHRFTGLVLGRAATGEHKAVRVRGDLATQTCEVVTIGRDDGGDGGGGGRARWRETQAPPAEVLFWPPTGLPDAAVVGGTAYFLVDPYPSRRRHRYGYTLGDFAEGGIACFDLAAERWSPRLLGGPPPSTGAEDDDDFSERMSSVALAALGGHLVVVHHDDEGKSLDLWFRTAESSGGGGEEASWSWSRRYAIPYDAIMPPADVGDRDAEPLWEMADGRLAVWVWRSCSSEEGGQRGLLRMYDPAENKCVDVVRMSNCLHVGAYTGGMLSEYSF